MNWRDFITREAAEKLLKRLVRHYVDWQGAWIRSQEEANVYLAVKGVAADMGLTAAIAAIESKADELGSEFGWDTLLERSYWAKEVLMAGMGALS